MQFLRVGELGAERPIANTNAGVCDDLTPSARDIDGAFLPADGTARPRRALAAGSLRPTAISGQRVGLR